MTRIWGIVSSWLLASSCSKFEVCTSPGCVSDGAMETLQRLQALSPSSAVAVVPCGCLSQCGKGPVVVTVDSKKTIEKRVDAAKVLKLLGEQVPVDLVEGYNMCIRGDDAAAKNEYSEAVTLYKEGIDKSLDIAKTLEYNLMWLAKAHISLAKCLMEQKPTTSDETTNALDLSVELDSNISSEAYLLKAQLYQTLKDDAGELAALKCYFDIEPPEKESREAANQRRVLGFRLQKLQSCSQ